jgi:hypothetical protein
MEGRSGCPRYQHAHVLDVINSSAGRVHHRLRVQAAGHAGPVKKLNVKLLNVNAARCGISAAFQQSFLYASAV